MSGERLQPEVQPEVQAEWDRTNYMYFYDLNYMLHKCLVALYEVNQSKLDQDKLEKIKKDLEVVLGFLILKHIDSIMSLNELCSKYPQNFFAKSSETDSNEEPGYDNKLFKAIVEASIQRIEECDVKSLVQKRIEIGWEIYYLIAELDQYLCKISHSK